MKDDMISRQAAMDALKGLPTWWADEGGYYGGARPPMEALLEPTDAVSAIENLPSVQPEPSTEIQEILDYLDTTLHPIVSPDNWNVYSELHDMISMLPSAQPDNSCDGCRYENADDGVLVPCGFCKRSHPDNYERRTDG